MQQDIWLPLASLRQWTRMFQIKQKGSCFKTHLAQKGTRFVCSINAGRPNEEFMVLIPLMEEMQREHGTHFTMAILLLDTHSHVPIGAAALAVWEAWAEVVF